MTRGLLPRQYTLHQGQRVHRMAAGSNLAHLQTLHQYLLIHCDARTQMLLALNKLLIYGKKFGVRLRYIAWVQ